MNKRKNIDIINESQKKHRVEKYAAVKNIIIRNDFDPFVYTTCPAEYIKIGEHIYKTKSFSEYPKEIKEIDTNINIALNINQFQTVTSYIFDSDKILIASYYNTITSISNLSINVTASHNNKITINKKSFVEFLRNYFLDHVISIEQDFFIDFNNCKLDINIFSLGGNTFGIIDKNTNIILSEIDNNIVVYDETQEITYDLAKVIVKKCVAISTNNINKSDNSKLPLIISHEKINNYVKNTFSDAFFADENIIIYHS